MQTEATSAPEPPEPASPPASTQPGPAEPVTSADETSAPASARSASAQPPSADLDPFDYVPRRFLSVAPKPQGAVVLQYPEGDAEADAVTFVLSLYIDEQGRVRHVRVDEGSPPERFVTAAVATFMQAHFEPGELQGQPVRSLVRVEVSYRVSR